MPDDGFYDGWNLSRPGLTGRSHLYSLAPIGVRTARVESLTGYISRLAAAHSVETGVLVNHELLPRVPLTKGPRSGQTPLWQPEYSFFLEAYSLNGTGDRARLWAGVLEELTGVRRLDLLTALPWAKAISCVHLLRTCRAWCSVCYDAQRSAEQPLYDALLWTLQTVTVCAEHQRRLDTVCHSCGRTQYMFSSKTRPGYCSRCQSWLGQEQQAAPAGRDIRAEVEAAEMMGDLVAASASFPAGIVLDVFRENLRGFIQDGGGAHRFRAAIDHSHIRNWVWRATIPRMDSFLKLARALNVSVVRLLTERIHGGSKLLQRRALQTPHKVSGGIVEAALQDAIQSGSPPALKDIATQLGYRTPASLQSRYPGLCGQIANSRQADVKASRPLRTPAMPVPRERIVTALIKELSAPGFTDLKAVAASVGLSSKRRLYKDFHELRTAIVAKNAQFRNRQGSPCGESALRAVIDGALHKAFDEQPIPTVAEVATRLGFADARPVDWRFPELTAALRSRRHRAGPTPARGDRVSERVRQRLTEALAESPPPSCSEIVKSLAGHRTQIREDFPDLWRDLRKRYVEDKRYTRQLKQQAFAGDVCCAVAELHKQGLHPSVRLVLASIPEPRFRSGRVVGEAIHLARLKLSIELYADYRVGHA